MSLGSSTTHKIVGSRRGSVQMRHCSDSATLPQIVQKCTSFFTRTRVLASRSTSSLSAASRWKAMRWALFGPTPGSRPSSSIRSWTAPSYTVLPCSEAEARQVEPAPAGERTHALRGQLVGGALGVADGGHHEVLQRLDVVGVDRGGRDRESGELTGAGHGGRDELTTRRAGHLGLGQLLLRRGEV